VVYSCLGIGVFYILTTYAATVYFGADRFAEFPTSGDGNPWDALARAAWGAGWVLVFLAIANSAIANANASANAATRTWFAMGRIRLLPRPFEHINPRWRSPDVAVAVQFVVGVGVAVWLGLQYGPLSAFALVGTIVTAVIIAIYMVVNLACLVFYLREGRAEFNLFLHGLVPVLGIAAFLPAFLTAVGIQAFDFVSALPYPISLVGPVVGVWYAIGLVYLVVLMTRRPERLRETGRVFVEEPAAETTATN
jgi:amino acid transporter